MFYNTPVLKIVAKVTRKHWETRLIEFFLITLLACCLTFYLKKGSSTGVFK